MICSICGANNSQDAGFCSKCGTRLSDGTDKGGISNFQGSPAKTITAYRDHKKLLVAPRDAVLPLLCVKCGETGTFHRFKFGWMNPVWLVLFFLGILPYLIARVALSRTVRLNVPLCDRHYNGSHRLMIAAWLCVAGAVPVGFLLAKTIDPQDVGIFTVACGFPVFLVGLVLMWAHNPLTATLIADDRAELSGACNDFLQAVPHRPVETPSQAR